MIKCECVVCRKNFMFGETYCVGKMTGCLC